jgi:hypothetical protein
LWVCSKFSCLEGRAAFLTSTTASPPPASPFQPTLHRSSMPAATPALVDGHVSEVQAKKAVDSLSVYAAKARAEKEETELLSKDENVWLVVSTKTINPEKKLKPVKM